MNQSLGPPFLSPRFSAMLKSSAITQAYVSSNVVTNNLQKIALSGDELGAKMCSTPIYRRFLFKSTYKALPTTSVRCDVTLYQALLLIVEPYPLVEVTLCSRPPRGPPARQGVY